jgi:hypothetical protein
MSGLRAVRYSTHHSSGSSAYVAALRPRSSSRSSASSSSFTASRIHPYPRAVVARCRVYRPGETKPERFCAFRDNLPLTRSELSPGLHEASALDHPQQRTAAALAPRPQMEHPTSPLPRSKVAWPQPLRHPLRDERAAAPRVDDHVDRIGALDRDRPAVQRVARARR